VDADACAHIEWVKRLLLLLVAAVCPRDRGEGGGPRDKSSYIAK